MKKFILCVFTIRKGVLARTFMHYYFNIPENQITFNYVKGVIEVIGHLSDEKDKNNIILNHTRLGFITPSGNFYSIREK